MEEMLAKLPAAIYVLLGVIISGIFTLISDWKNRSNNKELKELENKNNKEVQDIEISYKNKAQEAKEKGDRKLRLLDDKIKEFSDFYKNFSEILLTGTDKSRLSNIEKLRKTVFTIRLLTPNITKDLSALDYELVKYGNFLHDLINKDIKLTKVEIDKEIDKFTDKVNPIVLKICDLLPNEL